MEFFPTENEIAPGCCQKCEKVLPEFGKQQGIHHYLLRYQSEEKERKVVLLCRDCCTTHPCKNCYVCGNKANPKRYLSQSLVWIINIISFCDSQACMDKVDTEASKTVDASGLDVKKIDPVVVERAASQNAGCAGMCGLLENLHKCKGCYSVSYCSVACQKKDWPSHKKECKQKKCADSSDKMLSK